MMPGRISMAFIASNRIFYSAKCHSAKCHSAKCHSAKCHSAKCHSAQMSQQSVILQVSFGTLVSVFALSVILLTVILPTFSLPNVIIHITECTSFYQMPSCLESLCQIVVAPLLMIHLLQSAISIKLL